MVRDAVAVDCCYVNIFLCRSALFLSFFTTIFNLFSEKMKKVYLEKRCKSDVNLSDSFCQVNMNEFHSVNEILENTMELDDIDTLIHLELENYTSNDSNIICLGELMNLHTEYEDKKSSHDDNDFADYYQEDSKHYSIQPKATSGLQTLGFFI